MEGDQKEPSDAAYAWRFSASFLLGIAFISTPFWLLPDRETSAQLAACGGLIAFLGVILIARPVWRVGPFDYISLVIFRDMVDANGDPRYARLDDPDERGSDDAFQQVIGPMLVGMGTLLNGFSGYLG